MSCPHLPPPANNGHGDGFPLKHMAAHSRLHFKGFSLIIPYSNIHIDFNLIENCKLIGCETLSLIEDMSTTLQTVGKVSRQISDTYRSSTVAPLSIDPSPPLVDPPRPPVELRGVAGEPPYRRSLNSSPLRTPWCPKLLA